MSQDKVPMRKMIYFLLGVFQILGMLALNALTTYSMFSPESYTWIYIVLIGFTFGCSYAITVGIEKISQPQKRFNKEPVGSTASDPDKTRMTHFLNTISTFTMTLVMLLILINLISILHNANAIDQFFGIDGGGFREGEFTGHLILEILYFLWLIDFLSEGDVLGFIQNRMR
jgi:hypothetical protein